MGNESSVPIDDSVSPVTLKSRTIESLAEYISKGKAKKIVVMVGAGISTSAGIPDFRSPDTGLYANLARLNLPYAEAVFDISYFRDNPLPFYALAHELYPGKYRPTVTHSFISLLCKKGLLLKLFTQNIDCLDREAGVPDDKIVEAHGSFATQRCIECKVEYPNDQMKEKVLNKEVPHCSKCNGLVKPDIVFFGEALPAAFHANRGLPAEADLAIVMGTSLTVQPFASLPVFVTENTPRLLINLELVGGLGSRPDDVVLLMDCDSGVRKLADCLGWRDELEELWNGTDHETTVTFPSDEAKSKQQVLDDKIDELTKDIDKTLKLSQDQHDYLKQQLDNKEEVQSPKAEVQSPKAETQSPKAEAQSQANQPSERSSDLNHVYLHSEPDSSRKPSL